MTNFPYALDTFTNPTAGNATNNPSHASQHTVANLAIAALEAKVGIENSGSATSLDYQRGLIFITSVTVTSGSVVDITSCFSSSYNAYRVVISDIRLAAAGSMTFQLMSGSTAVTTNYAWGFLRVAYDATTAPTASGFPATVAQWHTQVVAGTASSSCMIDIFNPRLAQYTYYSVSPTDNRGTSGYAAQYGGGTHTLATGYDGLKFTLTASTFTNAIFRVYGYKN